MVTTQYLLMILGMWLVTYIPRCLPVSFLAQRQLPEWLIEWLDLIPVAIFGALIFPDLFLAGEPRHLDLLQPRMLVALPTFLFALKTRSLGGTVLIGMLLYWLAGKLL
jgi:branched-subunit amino acid transport protein